VNEQMNSNTLELSYKVSHSQTVSSQTAYFILLCIHSNRLMRERTSE